MRLAFLYPDELGVSSAAHLLASGHEVLGLGNPEAPALWPEGAVWYADAEAVELADCAVALLWPPTGIRGKAVAQAVERLARCLNALGEGGCRRVILWSDAGLYAPSAMPVRESAALAVSRFQRMTQASEDAAHDWQSRGDRAAFIFRAAPVVGPSHTKSTEAVAALPLPLRAQGAGVVQVVHESDAHAVLEAALTSEHPGLYNVASDGLIRWRDVWRSLGGVGPELPRFLVALLLVRGGIARMRGLLELAARLSGGRTLIDNARLKTHFGYRPRHGGRQALRMACAARRH